MDRILQKPDTNSTIDDSDISGEGIAWKSVLLRQETLLIVVYIAMIAVFTALNPRFLSSGVFANILQDFGPVMLMAIGQALIIITGGIDLSVGAVLGLSGVTGALTIRSLTEQGVGPATTIILGIIAAISTGAMVGLVNGLLVTRVRLAPFIATLATMSISMGITLVITGGVQIAGAPSEVVTIGNTRILGVFTIPLLIVLIAVLMAWLALAFTRFGRWTYAIGSNDFAARAAGIDVEKHLMKVYLLSGVLASIAGLFVYFRLGSGSPSSGRGGELQAIAAAVIGGIALTGGVGRITGVILGALITMSVLSGLILIGIEPNWQQVVVGSIIAIAVAVQNINKPTRS